MAKHPKARSSEDVTSAVPKEGELGKLPKRHAFCRRFPVLAMLLAVVICVFSISLTSAVLTVAVVPALPASMRDTVQYICIAIAGLIICMVGKRWFSPFDGCFAMHIGIPALLLLVVPFVVFETATVALQWAAEGFFFTVNPTLLSMALVAGIGEEAMFRSLSIPIGMGFMKAQKKIWIVTILTSVVFGVMHLTNISGSADVGSTILQVAASTFTALFFCAIYLRSGSLVPCMAMHSIHDFFSFATSRVLSQSDGILTFGVTWDMWVALLFAVLLGLAGLYMLRPVKHEEIVRIWNKKWGIG